MGRHPDTVQYFFVAYEIPFRYQECVGRIACCVSTAGIGGEGLDLERIVRAQRLGRSNYSRKAAGDVGHPLPPNLAGCGKMQEHRHSGARALPASPESRNTDERNQWLGRCSWFPGPALTGRPGMTQEFFSTLLDQITLKSVTQNAIVRITIFGSFRSVRRQANMPTVGHIPVHPTVNRPF
jgi:hypothetical protein